MTHIDKIYELEPGENYTVLFPENFTLKYVRSNNEIEEFNLSYLKVYFWDEDDHWGTQYYLYKEGDSNWVCKPRSLTEESASKLYKFLYQKI